MSLLTLTLLVVVAAVPAVAQGDGKIFPYQTHVEDLDNGLRAILIPMPSGGLVAYWSVVRTGSRDEYEPGHTGFAHFFEHMMFRGTENFPAEVYNAKITELGADANAYTTDDLTAYHLGIASQDLETVMQLESDRFENLSYAEPQFRTEAGAVYGEYRKNRTNPFFTLREAVVQKAFDAHTYGHTTMGYVEDIQRMPEMYDYSKSFFSRYYRPDNVVLLIVGDIEVEPTMDLIRKYYGDWEAGYVPPQIPEEPPQEAERSVEVTYEGRSLPILWITYKGDSFSPENKRLAAADLMTSLAFGETSELHKKLVLDEQVVEFLSAGAPMNRDAGTLDIITRIKDPSKVDYVLSEIDRTIAQYQQTPPDAERLDDVKSNLKYSFLMNLDTPDSVAGNLARIVAVTGGISAVDELYGTYEQVTPEDVREAAEYYLQPTRRTVGTLRGAN
jgi:zinc protease